MTTLDSGKAKSPYFTMTYWLLMYKKRYIKVAGGVWELITANVD